MLMKIKHMNENRYLINGMLVLAKTYKEAIAEYISVAGSGAKIQFARKG
jgi:hypothetical protein